MPPTSKNASASSTASVISSFIQYYKLHNAAAQLGCTTEELLHIGVLGKVEILAPIVAASKFVWPTRGAEVGFLELDTPFIHYFNAASRVALFPSDLAQIEAVGWTIPWRFYAPEYSRRVIETAPKTFEEALAERHAQQTQKDEELDRLSANANFPCPFPAQRDFDQEAKNLRNMREAAFYAPWIQYVESEEPLYDDMPKTTLENLFISKSELDRLREGRQQENPLPESEIGQQEHVRQPHAGVERHAKPRLESLLVAVWVYRKEIKTIVKDATKWARKVEGDSKKILPPGHTSERQMVRQLQLVLQDDPAKLFEPLQ
jgi:hypothetical protein